MSVVDDSPVNSSNSDDFAAFLDVELDSASDTATQLEPDDIVVDDDDGDDDEEEEEDHKTYKYLIESTKQRKVIVLDSTEEPDGPTSQIEQSKVIASVTDDICTHSGFIGGLCLKCGEKMDNQSGIAFGYIHKDPRLANDGIARLRERDLKNLLRHKKIYLVLYLNHTLLNSTRLSDVIQEEGYLMSPQDPMQDALRGSLFKLPFMHMATKLRPFVHTFLKEASNLFEMYIYTMGQRAYA